jgi:hypothetical protein
MSLCPSVCLRVCVSSCPSVCLSVCLCVCLSVCPPGPWCGRCLLLLLLDPLSESGSSCRDSELTQMFPDVILPVGSVFLAQRVASHTASPEDYNYLFFTLVEKYFSRKETFVWTFTLKDFMCLRYGTHSGSSDLFQSFLIAPNLSTSTTVTSRRSILDEQQRFFKSCFVTDFLEAWTGQVHFSLSAALVCRDARSFSCLNHSLWFTAFRLSVLLKPTVGLMIR